MENSRRLELTPTNVAGVFVALGLLGFLVLSVWLAIVDARKHRLPNRLVAAAAILGIVTLAGEAIVLGDPTRLWRGLLAAAACFVAYLLLHVLSRGGLGAGDVKLAAVLGLYLGWWGWDSVLAGICAGIVLGALFSAILLVFRRANGRSRVAFGPWMLAGAWLVLGASFAPTVVRFA